MNVETDVKQRRAMTTKGTVNLMATLSFTVLHCFSYTFIRFSIGAAVFCCAQEIADEYVRLSMVFLRLESSFGFDNRSLLISLRLGNEGEGEEQIRRLSVLFETPKEALSQYFRVKVLSKARISQIKECRRSRHLARSALLLQVAGLSHRLFTNVTPPFASRNGALWSRNREARRGARRLRQQRKQQLRDCDRVALGKVRRETGAIIKRGRYGLRERLSSRIALESSRKVVLLQQFVRSSPVKDREIQKPVESDNKRR